MLPRPETVLQEIPTALPAQSRTGWLELSQPARRCLVCLLWHLGGGRLSGEPTSEPETAVRVTNGKQGAGATQHRPGCRASS